MNILEKILKILLITIIGTNLVFAKKRNTNNPPLALVKAVVEKCQIYYHDDEEFRITSDRLEEVCCLSAADKLNGVTFTGRYRYEYVWKSKTLEDNPWRDGVNGFYFSIVNGVLRFPSESSYCESTVNLNEKNAEIHCARECLLEHGQGFGHLRGK